jgi:HEAT repeat protein
LRELGPYDDAERRPFTSEALPLLVDRLNQESDPRVLGWVISALGYNGAREALGEVLQFAEHPHWRVRFHVAAALQSLVDSARIEPGAMYALQQLCRDDEADTRFYALYALVEEVSGVDEKCIAQSITDLLNDPDEQIRRLARSHRNVRH